MIVVAGCALGCGCRQDTIAYHEGVPPTRAADRVSDEPRFRMVTAIADQPQATWFFKLSGPIEKLDEIQEAWSQWLQSVRFTEPEPSWSLPPEWASPGFEDRPLPGGSPMRIASIATADSEVTISVSSMPAGQALLPNVNRWRGQLGLPPIDEMQLTTQLSEVKTEQASFQVFDASGPQLTTRMGGGPFAGGGQPQSNAAAHSGLPQGSAAPDEDPGIDFVAPQDWQAGETSSMVLGRWSKNTEHGPAKLLLMRMSPTQESWKANVELWAQQVASEDTAKLGELTETIQVAGMQGRQIRLQGPRPQEPDNRAVHAVMFANPTGDGYVLQLTGDQAAVDDVVDEFQSLLESIRFRKTAG